MSPLRFYTFIIVWVSIVAGTVWGLDWLSQHTKWFFPFLLGAMLVGALEIVRRSLPWL